MAVELATAYIALVPSMKGASSKIAQELGSVDADGIGSNIGGRMGGGITSKLKGLVGPAMAAMAAVGFGGFIKDAAAASDATDKFVATMSFAGMDTSAITAAKDAAKSYADQTVYDLPTIQNMTAQLASNGVKDYTGLTQAAGNLNAVAGGNADTFKSVAMVMTQTAGAGKLTTENWNQMADAIPGAAGPLMKAMQDAGAYTGNFRDAMAAGQITSDEFNAALQKLGTDPVAVEAARSTKTFEGAIGGLQATINSGLMSALNAMKPAITGAINMLSGGLGKAFEWTGNAAKGLHDLFVKGDFSSAFKKAFHVEEDSGLVGVLFTIRSYITDLVGGFHAMFAAYKAGDGDVTSSGFAGVMERIGNAAREVTGGIRAFFAAFKAGDGDVTSSGFAGFMERLGNGARQLTRDIGAMFLAYKAGDGDVTSSGFAGFMERVGNTAREVTGGIRAFFAAFKAGGDDVTSSGFAGFLEGLGLKARALADQIGPVIGSIFSQLGPMIMPLIPQFLQLLSSISPIQTIFQALAPFIPQLLDVFVQLAVVVGQSLGTALTTIVPLFMQMQAVFISVFQQVLATALPVIVQLVTMLGQTFAQLLPILMPIVTTIMELAMTLISQLMPIFMQLVSTVLPMVVTIFGAVLGAIGPLISMLAGMLIPIIQMLMPVVVTVFGVIAEVIGTVMQIVMGIIQVVMGIISGNWGMVWEGILNIFSGIWNTIVAVVGGVLGIIGSIVLSGLSGIMGFVGSILGSIGSFFADTWNNIISGVSGFIGNLLNFFSGLPGQIMGFLSGAGTWLVQAGKDIINGLISGVSSMMGAIGNAILNLIPGPIVGVFKTALGIQSPSRVFRALGKHIPEGLNLGIGDGANDVASTMKNLVTIPDLPASSASMPGASSYGAGRNLTINNTINQVDDPIGTAHAIARRQVALSV